MITFKATDDIMNSLFSIACWIKFINILLATILLLTNSVKNETKILFTFLITVF